MDREEHLDKIVAKCRKLLARAEKRTEGKWEQEAVCGQSLTDICAPPTQNSGNPNLIAATVHDDDEASERQAVKNASFIASCAGPAEAGWRATITAIELLLLIRKGSPTQDWHQEKCDSALESIIAAWPEELL